MDQQFYCTNHYNTPCESVKCVFPNVTSRYFSEARGSNLSIQFCLGLAGTSADTLIQAKEAGGIFHYTSGVAPSTD